MNTNPSAADCKRGRAEKKGGRLGEVISHRPDKLQTAPSKCQDLRLFDRRTFPDSRRNYFSKAVMGGFEISWTSLLVSNWHVFFFVFFCWTRKNSVILIFNNTVYYFLTGSPQSRMEMAQGVLKNIHRSDSVAFGRLLWLVVTPPPSSPPPDVKPQLIST